MKSARFLAVLAITIFLLAAPGARAAAPAAAANFMRMCVSTQTARCHIRVGTDKSGRLLATTTPTGYSPADIHRAYQLRAAAPTKQILALVAAYDNPHIFNDVNLYSNRFGIPRLDSCPVSAGTASHPCFEKIDQHGGAHYPKFNGGWSMEVALDVELAHAICQDCSILLVEANSPHLPDLLSAEDAAVSRGAREISNSWGGPESPGELKFDAHFNHPGIAFVASSGDSGYGVSYPAASPGVTAVGGTTLRLGANGDYQSERAWSGSGSGCSRYEVLPNYQTKTTVCARRSIADVAAVADPATGLAIYNSAGLGGRAGWFSVGGTSASAPIIAGVFALAGGIPAGSFANDVLYRKAGHANLHDITAGSTGVCGNNYLCTAAIGYDGPTGLGSPKGSGAFY